MPVGYLFIFNRQSLSAFLKHKVKVLLAGSLLSLCHFSFNSKTHGNATYIVYYTMALKGQWLNNYQLFKPNSNEVWIFSKVNQPQLDGTVACIHTRMALKTVADIPSATVNSPRSFGRVKLLSSDDENILNNNKNQLLNS